MRVMVLPSEKYLLTQGSLWGERWKDLAPKEELPESLSLCLPDLRSWPPILLDAPASKH